ncbi:CatB-related O-acetyltransferase [Cyanobium sp. ATX 6A2]|uniref:CatB-related O-acetyltransferase n=1 Tax=Cyanobium sp. ATX 6A2 TaxID=2823700 RepID=UPI0028F3E780|nr:CatB-related O-acetyltransferase [Cyanobium sp. ATX 6A2]
MLSDVDLSNTHSINPLLYQRCYFGRLLAPPYRHPQVRIGAYTYGFRRETFFAYHPSDYVEVGKFCSIADGVRFVFGEHQTDNVASYPLRALCFGHEPHADSGSKGPISIGNDVWIGANAIILSGVNIGDGAVIAAGGVVTCAVPAYAVFGGVPARLLRQRLPADQVAALLRIRWWDWPIEKIKHNADLFYGSVAEFISMHE